MPEEPGTPEEDPPSHHILVTFHVRMGKLDEIPGSYDRNLVGTND